MNAFISQNKHFLLCMFCKTAIWVPAPFSWQRLTQCFVFPNIFFQKLFNTETLQWPVGGSEILAGCCTILCFLLFSSITMRRRGELYRNQSNNTVIASLHPWQYPAAIVKPFYRCCLVSFLLLQYLLVTVIKSKYCRSCTNPLRPFLIFIFHSFFHTTDVNPQMHDPSVLEIGQWVRAIWQ